MKLRVSVALGGVLTRLRGKIKRSLSLGTGPCVSERRVYYATVHNAVNPIRKTLVRDEMTAGSKLERRLRRENQSAWSNARTYSFLVAVASRWKAEKEREERLRKEEKSRYSDVKSRRSGAKRRSANGAE